MTSLFSCLTFKISDRLNILQRVMSALQADPDCRLSFKGTWREMTPDEKANWEARQTILVLGLSFPIGSIPSPATAPVESEHEEPVEEPTAEPPAA